MLKLATIMDDPYTFYCVYFLQKWEVIQSLTFNLDGIFLLFCFEGLFYTFSVSEIRDGLALFDSLPWETCLNSLFIRIRIKSHFPLKSQSICNVKGCVCYIFAGLFCMSKREHFKNKEKCFLFHFESSFHS